MLQTENKLLKQNCSLLERQVKKPSSLGSYQSLSTTCADEDRFYDVTPPQLTDHSICSSASSKRKSSFIVENLSAARGLY